MTFRDIKYGFQNYWRFRKVLWRWRGWDYSYSYRLFVEALEQMADQIEENDRHDEAMLTVGQIRDAVAAWKAYEAGPPNCYDYEAFADHEDRTWRWFHTICEKSGRRWWD